LARTVKQTFGQTRCVFASLGGAFNFSGAIFHGNTLITNITKTYKFIFYSRIKWLVLPTPRATQYLTVKSKAQNSVLSEHKPHHLTGKNDGDTANRIQKHQQTPSSVPPTFWIPAVFGSEESNIFFTV
jgi:hypothetical protein